MADPRHSAAHPADASNPEAASGLRTFESTIVPLTQVELIYQEGKIERWIRFGHPADDRIVDG